MNCLETLVCFQGLLQNGTRVSKDREEALTKNYIVIPHFAKVNFIFQIKNKTKEDLTKHTNVKYQAFL